MEKRQANKGSAGVDGRTGQVEPSFSAHSHGFRRRGTTIFRELHRPGASRDLAARVAGNASRWWRNSAMGLNFVLTLGYFNRLAVPRFS